MEKNILSTEGTGLVNESRFAIRQLNKSWEAIIENLDKYVFFANWKSGKPLPFAFNNVDLLSVCDINGFLKDPDTSLFMLVAQEEVEA